MRKSRFSETQIVSILKEHDAGTTFVELGRRYGVHPNTVAAWKVEYGRMESSELARSRAIEEENTRMRRIIANLSLENDAMNELISKNSWGSRSKNVVRALQELGLSQRTACRIANCPGSVIQYRPRRTDEPELAEKIKGLPMKRRRFGYRRIAIVLRREGTTLNHKRVHRIYRKLGLQIRARHKRGVRYLRGIEVQAATRPNDRWSIDFVHDTSAT